MGKNVGWKKGGCSRQVSSEDFRAITTSSRFMHVKKRCGKERTQARLKKRRTFLKGKIRTVGDKMRAASQNFRKKKISWNHASSSKAKRGCGGGSVLSHFRAKLKVKNI